MELYEEKLRVFLKRNFGVVPEGKLRVFPRNFSNKFSQEKTPKPQKKTDRVKSKHPKFE